MTTPMRALVARQRETAAVDAWNAAHKVGTPVVAYPGARPPKAARKLITRTRSAAWLADHGKPVVMVDGLVGWISLTHVDPFRATDTSPEASAARNVPNNPRPLCRDFTSKAAPSEFWCQTCGWNKPMHADEDRRTAIANALACLPAPLVSRPASEGEAAELRHLLHDADTDATTRPFVDLRKGRKL